MEADEPMGCQTFVTPVGTYLSLGDLHALSFNGGAHLAPVVGLGVRVRVRVRVRHAPWAAPGLGQFDNIRAPAICPAS